MKTFMIPYKKEWAVKTTDGNVIERFVIHPRCSKREVVTFLPYYSKLWGPCKIVRVRFDNQK